MPSTPDQPLPQVLCVDDEKGILRALRRVLMDEECDVTTANSGAEALELLPQLDNLALIISDQRMPEMTGVEFLQQAKKLRPSAYRVMLTGYADINATMDAVNKGEIWRYVTKPWDDDAIIALVRDAIRQYQLEQENTRLHKLVQRQAEELKQWNERLKQRVLAQTNRIREKHEELAYANKQLRQSFDQTLLAFARLIELRDKNFKNHSHNTCAITEKSALKLRLDKKLTEDIRIAALLHGIGKIGTPDHLLRCRYEDLSASDKIIYDMYTVRGQTTLDPIAELRSASVIIRHIMENYDGSGTPDKLKGDKIPLGSRIIAIAEHIDRQLGSGAFATLDLIIEDMEKLAGKRFDADLLPIVAKAARDFYAEANIDDSTANRREVPPGELEEGMMVLRDVYSGTGLLLLKQGSILTAETIASLQRYYKSDPPDTPVLVFDSNAD